MLKVCEEFACSYHFRFNPAKTQLIRFASTMNFPCSYIFCGQRLTMLDSVVHLGNYLMMNLSDDLDIQMKSMDFIKQANTVFLRFNFPDSVLKKHLFQSYCLSFYGGALWHLSLRQIKALEVSYNNMLRWIWSLPSVSHTAIAHLVAELESAYNCL